MEQEEIIYNSRTDALRNLAVYGYDLAFLSSEGCRQPHYHRASELLYVDSGHISVFMGQKKYELGPGDLLLIDSMKIHTILPGFAEASGVILEFSKNHMRMFSPDLEVMCLDCCSQEDPNSAAMLRLKEILAEMTRLRTGRAPSSRLRTGALVLELLALLEENYCSHAYEVVPEKNRRQMERIGALIDFGEKNYHRPVTLQEAADHMGLNREYFCRFFKKTMGCSFLEYMCNVRLHHIYQDLLISNDPISLIAERNGFGNQKLFYVKFREKYGCAPGELRKRLKNKEGSAF